MLEKVFAGIDMRDGARELATDAAVDAESLAKSPMCAKSPMDWSGSSSGAAFSAQLRASANSMSCGGSTASWRFGVGVAGVPGGGASSGRPLFSSGAEGLSLLASRFSPNGFEGLLLGIERLLCCFSCCFSSRVLAPPRAAAALDEFAEGRNRVARVAMV